MCVGARTHDGESIVVAKSKDQVYVTFKMSSLSFILEETRSRTCQTKTIKKKKKQDEKWKKKYGNDIDYSAQ